jgi:DUF1365 family protein
LSQDVVICLVWTLWQYQSTMTWSEVVIHTALRLGLWLSQKHIYDQSRLEGAEAGPITDEHTKQGTSTAWAKPLIFPCRTAHSRMFPQKHSFSYSYLFVGVPVGWSGYDGSLLTADNPAKRGWFHVDPANYLARGDGHLGLRGKLDAYLQSQDVSPHDFPYAYLTTAPRCLGYSFNPVSFWYLYSKDRSLGAMILEVNNTFDERRMYLLKSEPRDDAVKIEQNLVDKLDLEDDQAQRCNKTFTSEWKKDFHVSPFNSREGSYKLTARDLAPFEENSSYHIANTITLLSSEGHKKLVASVFTVGAAIDPGGMSTYRKLTLAFRWGWVGFVTFPRIVKEAYRLYFKKSLAVFFRPEVAKSSISRHATTEEKILESFFCSYLKDIVDNAQSSVMLSYRPAPGTGTSAEIVLRSPSATEKADQTCDLDILSPAFYSRFVHYAHTSEAVDREFLCTDVRNRTISIHNAACLGMLFQTQGTASKAVHTSKGRSLLTRVLWQLMRRLRCAAAVQSYTEADTKMTHGQAISKDIRALPLSNLDLFVLQTSTNAFDYRRTVTNLFLAQRFAFGLTAIINTAEFMLKLALIYGTTTVLVKLLSSTHYDHHIGASGMSLFSSIVAAGSLHVYSQLKGFEGPQ